MSARKAVFGLCALCALLFSGADAQGAGAATNGTTAFTCINTGNGTLWGEHCLGSNPGDGAKQEYGHIAIGENEKTHAAVTNAKTASGTTASTPLILTVVIGGVMVKLKATTVTSTKGAWLENSKAESGEHYSHGEGKILFEGVTVVEPANCKVTSALGEGVVETEQLVSTTKGQGMNVLFTPAVGEVFATFSIANNGGVCAAAIENIKIVGSVKAQPDEPGATISYSEIVILAEKTLRFGSKFGPAAGLEGKLTTTAGKEPETEPTHPISRTTVETP